MFWPRENWRFLFSSPTPSLSFFALAPTFARPKHCNLRGKPTETLATQASHTSWSSLDLRPAPLDLALSPPNGGAELGCQVSLHKYSCSSVISTLGGIENKQRLQTLSIDNAWSLLDYALSMDNVCNRCLFSIPSSWSLH